MHAIRLLVTLAFVALLLAATPAQGASSDLVVSQLYASGGNTGAAYANDYVELLNRGSTTVALSGWSLQYATAAGTTWQVTALSGSVEPGRYFLVQLASSAAVGSSLPTPDLTGTTNLAASGGKVAVVRDPAALVCGASAGSCSANPLVADLVGYGSASDYEGAPAPAPSAANALLRASAGCADTDANATDLATGPAAPRNGSAPGASCASAAPPPVASASAGAAIDLDVEPVLSIALDHASLSFGSVAAGDTPTLLPERVTVLSNDTAGYTLTVHRSAFSPADLPLGIAGSAPAGTTLAPALAGGAIVAIPVVPAADLVLGTSSARSSAAGDPWPTSLGFTTPLPVLGAGHYSAAVTFTVIGR